METTMTKLTKKAVVIDGRAVTNSGRALTQDEVRVKARSLLGTLEDIGPNPGDHGFFLQDKLFYYHVASVGEGWYVASVDPRTPTQTRAMVRRALAGLCRSCQARKAEDDGFCDHCFPSDGSSNQGGRS